MRQASRSDSQGDRNIGDAHLAAHSAGDSPCTLRRFTTLHSSNTRCHPSFGSRLPVHGGGFRQALREDGRIAGGVMCEGRQRVAVGLRNISYLGIRQPGIDEVAQGQPEAIVEAVDVQTTPSARGDVEGRKFSARHRGAQGTLNSGRRLCAATARPTRGSCRRRIDCSPRTRIPAGPVDPSLAEASTRSPATTVA